MDPPAASPREGSASPEASHLLPDSWLRGLDNTDRVEVLDEGAVLVVDRDGRRIVALGLVEAPSPVQIPSLSR